MSEHDKTPEELIAEGRRWVLCPIREESGEYYALVVFEDHPFPFRPGLISNDPATAPPMRLGRTRQEAEAKAEAWTREHRGIDGREYLEIVASSMKAETVMNRFVVAVDDHTCKCTLATGFGDTLIVLGEDEAARLYVKLAQAYDWTHDDFCPECDQKLEDGVCPNCSEQTE